MSILERGTPKSPSRNTGRPLCFMSERGERLELDKARPSPSSRTIDAEESCGKEQMNAGWLLKLPDRRMREKSCQS